VAPPPEHPKATDNPTTIEKRTSFIGGLPHDVDQFMKFALVFMVDAMMARRKEGFARSTVIAGFGELRVREKQNFFLTAESAEDTPRAPRKPRCYG
jgi:hypothetical protein